MKDSPNTLKYWQKREIQEDCIKFLISELSSAHTTTKMRELLKTLLTPKELADIALRLEIIKMLERGISHRGIASELKVSVSKVTRLSQTLPQVDPKDYAY